MSTVTISVSEGVFVFRGSRPDGGSAWTFLRRNDDGSHAPSAAPARFKRFLKPKGKKKNG